MWLAYHIDPSYLWLLGIEPSFSKLKRETHNQITSRETSDPIYLYKHSRYPKGKNIDADKISLSLYTPSKLICSQIS